MRPSVTWEGGGGVKHGSHCGGWVLEKHPWGQTGKREGDSGGSQPVKGCNKQSPLHLWTSEEK